MDPQTGLDARPRTGEMVARYEQMQQRIRDQLDADLGPFPWQVRSEGDRTGCGGEFADPDWHRDRPTIADGVVG